MADDNDNQEGLNPQERLIQEAKKKFASCVEFESNARKLFLEDIKFDAADSDNRFQWPTSILENRGTDRPALTINKTHQHNLQIINDGKQNTPAIKVSPTGNGASAESAQVFADVIRRVEYISNAKSAYDTALSFAVRGGIGYLRVYTDYVHDDTFDQDLFIGRVKDPLSIYLDPDINEPDGSDAQFGFAFEDRPRDEVFKEYPELKSEDIGASTLNSSADNWITKDHIRIAEYYRKVRKKDRLVLITEPDVLADGMSPNPNAGRQMLVKASDVPKQILDLALKVPDTKQREIAREMVEWYKIVGNKIVDSRTLEKGDALPIPYIPIVRVIGEETIIEGKLDRKGHTRALKDPNRMLNYNASAFIEFGALQSKTPYVAPARAIEGLETYWRTANRVNHDVLPYNDVDDNGAPIAPPQRQQPPMSAPVYQEGMQDAERWMMMVSGQYQAQTGEQENAKSGKAINARQRQGDNATYHFIDNLAMGLRLVGKILIAWIPHVYDTERVLKIRAEDGTEKDIKIDPNAREALVEKKDAQKRVVESIFNPKVGRYEVQADVGPGYATKRQEAFNAFSQIAIANPDAMNTIGDYVFLTMDVPYAQEIAERYKRRIPPEIKGEGPPPEVVALRGELENVKGLLTDVVTQLAEKDLELKGVRADKSVDEYNADTKRLETVAKIDPNAVAAVVAPIVAQTVLQALSDGMKRKPDDEEPGPMALGADQQDLPPLGDVPIDLRPQIDATLSNGNPNG